MTAWRLMLVRLVSQKQQQGCQRQQLWQQQLLLSRRGLLWWPCRVAVVWWLALMWHLAARQALLR
jgi:hypothetical protein